MDGDDDNFARLPSSLRLETSHLKRSYTSNEVPHYYHNYTVVHTKDVN